MRSARYWYEPRTFLDGAFGSKSAEFIGWAACIFKGTKKLLSRRPIADGSGVRTEWFGPEAWEAVSNGRLVAV